MQTQIRISGVLALFALVAGCKGSDSKGQSIAAPAGTQFKITASSSFAPVFSSESGACFANTNQELIVAAKSDVDDKDVNETQYEIVKSGSSKGIDSLFDLEAPASACALNANSALYFPIADWKFTKFNPSTDKPPVVGPVNVGQPGARQILVQISSDLAKSPIKDSTGNVRCDLKFLRDQSFLVSIDDNSPDIALHIRNKHLPIVVSDETINTFAERPGDDACKSRRGLIYLPDFKCIAFGNGFSAPGDINAQFRDANRCQLSL